MKPVFRYALYVLVPYALVIGIGSAFAHGARHGHDPARMKKFVDWRVNETLDEIDATDAQRTQILGIVDGMVAKVQAEHAVLNANGSADATKGLLGARRTLATGAIRPCSGIFGPEDRFMTQRWLDAGQTDIIIPWVTIDYIYVENVVWGHLLLEKALLDRPAKCGGQAFCVTNGEPVMGQDFHKALAYWCERVTGRKHLVKNLPYAPIAAMCYVVEAFERLTRTRVGGDVGNLTPAMLATATVSYTFSHAKAARELGYKPLYTLDEALHRTVRQWRDFKAARDAQ